MMAKMYQISSFVFYLLLTQATSLSVVRERRDSQTGNYYGTSSGNQYDNSALYNAPLAPLNQPGSYYSDTPLAPLPSNDPGVKGGHAANLVGNQYPHSQPGIKGGDRLVSGQNGGWGSYGTQWNQTHSLGENNPLYPSLSNVQQWNQTYPGGNPYNQTYGSNYYGPNQPNSPNQWNQPNAPNQGPYGNQWNQTHPVPYGQGSQGAYGQGSQGAYGQGSQGNYGQGSQGTYGQGSQGPYGQGTQWNQTHPVPYGQQGNQWNQTHPAPYGQGSHGTYGQGSQWNQTHPVPYGQGSQGAYGQGSQGTYGQGSQWNQTHPASYGQGSQGIYGQGGQGSYGQGSQGTYGQGSQWNQTHPLPYGQQGNQWNQTHHGSQPYPSGNQPTRPSSPQTIKIRSDIRKTYQEVVQCVSACPTTKNYAPICGTDLKTYPNIQALSCAYQCGADVRFSYNGAC